MPSVQWCVKSSTFAWDGRTSRRSPAGFRLHVLPILLSRNTSREHLIPGACTFSTKLDCTRSLNIPFHIILLCSLHTVLPVSRIALFLIHPGELLFLLWNAGWSLPPLWGLWWFSFHCAVLETHYSLFTTFKLWAIMKTRTGAAQEWYQINTWRKEGSGQVFALEELQV